MFDILHIIGNSPITMLRTDKILTMVMIHPREGEAYDCYRVIHATRELMQVEINYTRVAEMDLTIVLRKYWSCLNLRIWSTFGERDASLGKVIIVGRHGFK